MSDEANRILVVDDDEDIRATVADELESAGYAVEQAENGVAALASVDRRRPHLILLDMRMPVMDGWAFAAEFHRRYGPDTPIVVFTAAPDARARALEVGAAAWLPKPFELDDLLAVIGRSIGQSPEKS